MEAQESQNKKFSWEVTCKRQTHNYKHVNLQNYVN